MTEKDHGEIRYNHFGHPCEQQELVSFALVTYEPDQLHNTNSHSFNDELDPNPIFASVIKKKQVPCNIKTETKQAHCDIKESVCQAGK